MKPSTKFDLNEIHLVNPSLHCFCVLCKKILTNTPRIIAKIQHSVQTYFSFCVPCLCSEKNPYRITEYITGQSISTSLPQFAGLTAEQVLRCIQDIQDRGIEQFVFKDENGCINSTFETYQRLNKDVFSKEGLAIDLSLAQPSEPPEQMVIEKAYQPNKKHLNALGYNWEREEFSQQPEAIFGFMLGHLEESQEPTEEEIQLRNILFKYHQQQKDAIQQVNQYLKNSPFLLGRKGLQNFKDVPPEISELRSMEDQVKNLINEVNIFTKQPLRDFQLQEERKEASHRKTLSGGEKQEERQRSREQQLLQNKDGKGQGTERRRRGRRSKRQIQALQRERVKSQSIQQSSIFDPSESSSKRKGRPKGSKNKPKSGEKLQLAFQKQKLRRQRKRAMRNQQIKYERKDE